MSIFIENVDWSQTNDAIIIKIPIHGKKVTDNVIITDKFIKVNVHPYYYELFFDEAIRAEESSCKILESCIKCTLKKSNGKWWEQLGKPSRVNGKSNDKCILNELRKETRAEYEEKVQAESIKQRNERTKLKRDMMNKAIDHEQRIRKQIASVEENLKEHQLGCCSIKEPETTVSKQKVISKVKTPVNDVPTKPEPTMPPIRSSGIINVTFSERRFVTPKRESQEQAEREWCAKQHEIMTKTVGFSDDDLNAEERDAQWLLQKGREFLEKKNYLGAISAFGSGIRVADELPDLYLGRAEAQFHLGNFKRCVSSIHHENEIR